MSRPGTSREESMAKGVQGTKPEDSVKWAAGELKKIYG